MRPSIAKHTPALCRKCRGPIARKNLTCTSCGTQGRMKCYIPKSKLDITWGPTGMSKQGDSIVIDLSERNDLASQLIRESSGKDKVRIAEWGGGTVSY